MTYSAIAGAGGVTVTVTRSGDNLTRTSTAQYATADLSAVAGVNSTDVGTSFNKDDPNSGTFNANATGVATDALFTLKHTKNYAKKKSQFVIFVTPEIIDNASDGSEDMKRNFRVKVK